MQEIEKYQLENIVVKRQQFGELRYQLKTESLLFEQREQIQTAFLLIQDLMSSNQENTNEFIQITLTKNIQRIDKRGLEFYFEKSELEQVSNDSNLGLGLNQLLKDNLDLYSNNKDQSIDFFQDEIFILELSLAQQQQYYCLSLQNEGRQKQQQFIKNIVKKQIKQDPQFSVNNQKELKRKYSSQINSQVTPFNQNKCRIIVFGLESQQNEFDQFYNKYNNEYYLNDLVLTTEQAAGQNQKKYNPFKIFNHLLRKENREIISYLHQNEYNQNTLFSKLQELKFVENYNALEIYFIISQIVEDCQGICRWNSIIIHNIQYTDASNTNEKNQVLSEFEKYEKRLDEVYKQQERRFQDEFLEFKDSTQCEKCNDNQQQCDECEKVLDLFQNFQPYDLSNLDEKKPLNKILYYKNDQGIALYSKNKLQMMVKKEEYPDQPDITQYENLNQKLAATHKNIIRHFNYFAQLKTGNGDKFNLGELGLLVGSDIEEGKKVISFKFELKQSTKDFIKICLDNSKYQQNQNKQNENKSYSIIQNYLIKILAVKLKRILYNPLLREIPYPPRQENQDKQKQDLKHYLI